MGISSDIYFAAECTDELCVSDLLDEYGVRLNVLGKKELLPPSVQAAVEKAEQMTAKNTRYVKDEYFRLNDVSCIRKRNTEYLYALRKSRRHDNIYQNIRPRRVAR